MKNNELHLKENIIDSKISNEKSRRVWWDIRL